jgi:hypothetical protein
MDAMTRVGFAIIVGLAASAGLTVVLVAATNVPVWAGLGVLAGVDVVIIAWGYVAVQRAAAQTYADASEPRE